MKGKIVALIILFMLLSGLFVTTCSSSENKAQTEVLTSITPGSAEDNTQDDSFGFIEWKKTYDSGYWDAGHCIQPTTDGGYICVGHGYGYDVWLVKIDNNGNKQWENHFHHQHPDYGWFVLQTDDEGYLILAETAVGGTHVWLIKTDKMGNKQWERFIGYKAQSACRCIQPTKDGGYILAGYTAPSAWLSSYDVWLLKVDSQGFEEWNRTFEQPYYNWAFYVSQTSDDGYIITGLKCQTLEDYSDLWLIKTDSNGYMQWNKIYGDKAPAEIGKCVKQTSDGGYIIAGQVYEPPNNILIKTDSQGNAIWTKLYGGNCVLQTTDGGYITTGQKMRITGFYDISITKVNENGSKEWERLYGRKFVDDYGNFIIQTSDGGFIVIGSNQSYINYPAPGSDFWVIKTGEKPLGKNKDLNSASVESEQFLMDYFKNIIEKKPLLHLLELISKF